MKPSLNNQTRVYLSASASPSGFGVTVYNALFERHAIDAVYVPRSVTDASALVASLRTLRISGCSVSMPLKTQVVPLLDELDPLARELGSVNTITRADDGRLRGFNTDYTGARACIEQVVGPLRSVLVYGAGSVAGTLLKILADLGVDARFVHARRPEAAQALARQWDARAWDGSAREIDLLINATPASRDEPDAVVRELISRSRAVFDLVIAPDDTAWIRHARAAGCQVVAGIEMGIFQFQDQFAHYTGIRPTIAEIREVVETRYFRR